MRLLILNVFFCSSFIVSAQSEFMQWTTVGVTGDLVKKMDWSAEINTRVGSNGLETFFPQVGVDYKLTDWMKPSIDYRFIVDKNKIGNYKSSHRINFNIDFKKSIERFTLSTRIRYQLGFKQLGAVPYNDDFDPAFRFKPGIDYDIDNSIITPKVSAEFFYNPKFGPEGRQFTRIRYSAGVSFELDSPHDISIKYQLDQRLHDYGAGLRHVLVIGYAYKL